MELFDVQITTDIGECIVLQIYANNPSEAEMTAIKMVEEGEAGTVSFYVLECFTL